MRPVAATGARSRAGCAPGRGHDARRLRRHERRVGERGKEKGLDPLGLGQRGGHSQQRLAREDDRAFGNGPDVALESERAQHREECGVRVCEGGKAANPLDLIGRKGQREEVADRLFEPGEDEVGAMWRHSPDEKLERGPLLRHARGEVAGHHRELVQVGDRTEGPPIGPERNGGLRVLVHHAGPAVLGRSSQSGASIASDRPARAAAGSMSSRAGRLNCVGYSRTSSQRPRSAADAVLRSPS